MRTNHLIAHRTTFQNFRGNSNTSSGSAFLGTINRLLALVCLASILPCVSIPALAQSTRGAASEKELLAKFQDAFSKKDVAKFQNLIYKPGLSKKAQASMVYVFKSDSGGTAKNHRLIGRDSYDKALTKKGRKPINGPVLKDGIIYDYPIPLYGYLMFDLKTKDGSVIASYPVGKSNDQRLFFVARIIVKRKAPD